MSNAAPTPPDLSADVVFVRPGFVGLSCGGEVVSFPVPDEFHEQQADDLRSVLAAAFAKVRAEERERWAKKLDEDVRELREAADSPRCAYDGTYYGAQADVCQSIAGALRSEN